MSKRRYNYNEDGDDEEEEEESSNFLQRDRYCQNCQGSHALRECTGPTDKFGYIGGCPKCGVMNHTLARCHQKLDKNDIKHFIFRSKAKKAPAIWDEDLKNPAYRELLDVYKTWTSEFSRAMSRRYPNGAPFEKSGTTEDKTWHRDRRNIPPQIHPDIPASQKGVRHNLIFDAATKKDIKKSTRQAPKRHLYTKPESNQPRETISPDATLIDIIANQEARIKELEECHAQCQIQQPTPAGPPSPATAPQYFASTPF